MCRSTTEVEGGRRCQGHLTQRLGRYEDELTKLNNRVRLLEAFATYLTTTDAPFKQAREAFAAEQDINPESLPSSRWHLRTALESALKRQADSMTVIEKCKVDLEAITAHKEAEAEAYAALPAEVRERRERKAAAERARRARLKAEREEAEAVTTDEELRARVDATVGTRSEYAQGMQRFENAESEFNGLTYKVTTDADWDAWHEATTAHQEYVSAASLYVNEEVSALDIIHDASDDGIRVKLEDAKTFAAQRNSRVAELRLQPEALNRHDDAKSNFFIALDRFEKYVAAKQKATSD